MIEFSEDTVKLLELLKKKEADCFYLDRKIHQIKAYVKGKKKDVIKNIFRVDKTYLDVGIEYNKVIVELRNEDFFKKNKLKPNEFILTDKAIEYIDSEVE